MTRMTRMERMERLLKQKAKGVKDYLCTRDEGLDGILVTVGLCVIALLLCVVMKDSLEGFIKTIVTELTKEAKNILSGPVVTP